MGKYDYQRLPDHNLRHKIIFVCPVILLVHHIQAKYCIINQNLNGCIRVWLDKIDWSSITNCTIPESKKIRMTTLKKNEAEEIRWSDEYWQM